MSKRVYVETAEPTYEWEYWPPWYYALCGHCGWEGPSRAEWREAEHDRWRHPALWCWLKSRWLDSAYHPKRLAKLLGRNFA